jgi:Uma2 family endonuclease
VHEVLALVGADPTLREPLAGAPDYLRAEAVYAASHEGARHLDDILARRTRISIETIDRGIGVADEVARLVGPVSGNGHELSVPSATLRAMTALPLPPTAPQPLLTVAQFAALPEDNSRRYELVEGNIVMSPRPLGFHQRCLHMLLRQVDDQLPGDLIGLAEVDVDLGLVPPTKPGFVRIPDLVVVPLTAMERQRREGGLFRAVEVTLAVEVISPGSRRLDTVVKRDEYADAGIPYYWVVDLGEPGDRITLTAHHVAGAFGYADAGPVSGTFATTEPFPVRVDLDALS